MSHQDRMLPIVINHQTIKQVVDWLFPTAVLAWIPIAVIGLRIYPAGQMAEVLVDRLIPYRGINRTGIAGVCFRATECGCRWCQSRLRPEEGCGRVSEIVRPRFVRQAELSRWRR